MATLRFGPLGANSLHVAVDMQRLFAEPTAWHTPDLMAILPVVERLSAASPERTVFSRFITPRNPEVAVGSWQRYYRHWRALTLARIDPAQLGLVSPLTRLTPPALVVDKRVHSVFDSLSFQEILRHRKIDTLIFSGVETDVCVLASVLQAVDKGHRTLVVRDAVASSSAEGHRATLEAVLPRFDQQIEVVDSDDLLRSWPP